MIIPRQTNIMHLVLNLDVGGLELVAINLLRGLNKQRFRPVMACLLNGGTLVREVEKMGIEVEILNKPDKLDFSVSFKLAKILKKRNINLIHTHNTGAYLYGSIAAKLAGVSAIVHTEHGRNFPDKKRLMLTEKILSTFTYKIVTVSQDLKDALIRFEKIDPKKITVIPNGIDLDLFRPLPKDAIMKKRYEIGLDKDDFVIGNIGRLAPVKDHKNLIHALKLVRKSVPCAKLVIVGDGPLKKELLNFSQDLGLQENILFLGERSDAPEILNTFDIFVLSSKSEGISLTLLEAMATRKPVVATCVGGNREIIEDEKDGYLVPSEHPQRLAQVILGIAEKPQNLGKTVNSAYQKVKARYSLEKMVDQYQRIYEKALLNN